MAGMVTRRRSAARAGAALALLTLTLGSGPAIAVEDRAGEDAGAPPCPTSGAAIAVATRSRELWLCEEGAPTARFAVSLGRGGVGKRRHGDGRTPLGTYRLGAPRPSRRFGVFIPIDYPTAAQAARGFSGGAVGIHGPPRGLAGGLVPTTELDWTLGCIATGSDEDAGAIAAFVRARRAVVVIR